MNNDSVKDIHSLTPWLENLPFNWHPILEKGTMLKLKKHEIIFNQSETADFVYIVHSGRVRLFLISSNGEEKALAIIGKNGLIGECGSYEDEIYSTSAITATPTILYKINKVDFEQLLKKHFFLVEQVLFLTNRKYKLLCMQTLQLSYSKALPRICAALVQLALNYGTTLPNQDIQISITFTHQELANLIGTTRVTVVKTLRYLEDQAIVIKQKRYYKILSMDQLVTLANSE